MHTKSISQYRIEEHERKEKIRAYKAGQIKILRRQGMSYREIAKELNIKNESSVRTLAKQIPVLDALLDNDIKEKR